MSAPLRFSHLTTLLAFCAPLPAAAQGFFFDAAALYYQAQENGLGYTIKTSPTTGPVKNPPFEWDFGFKVGFGYQFPRDAWQLALRFTSLQTHADALTRAHPGAGLVPLWMRPTPTPPSAPLAATARMHWRLHLGVLDFGLSRTLEASRCIRFTPHIGISSAWVRQKFSVEYCGGELLPDRESLIRTKNKFSGVGPYCGVVAQWTLGCAFSLFAQADVRGWYGEFYLHQDEDLLVSKDKVLGVHSIYHQGTAAIEAIGGVQWERTWTGTLKRCAVCLAWDQWLFFAQNQLMRFVTAKDPGQFFANQGDLSLRGVELAFCFDF